MAVKIRLSRVGKKHDPMYRIVAVDSRQARDGKYIENLGTYNPLSHELVTINQERIEYWMSQGATPTNVVEKLYKNHKRSAA